MLMAASLQNHVPHQPETLYLHQKPEMQAAAEYPI
jgi:hypothetical protein